MMLLRETFKVHTIQLQMKVRNPSSFYFGTKNPDINLTWKKAKFYSDDLNQMVALRCDEDHNVRILFYPRLEVKKGLAKKTNTFTNRFTRISVYIEKNSTEVSPHWFKHDECYFINIIQRFVTAQRSISTNREFLSHLIHRFIATWTWTHIHTLCSQFHKNAKRHKYEGKLIVIIQR